MIALLGFACLGAAAASLLACVPGLHVYNLIGMVAFVAHSSGASGAGDWFAPLVIGMVVGYSLASAIPSVLLSAPDESLLFAVHPGQKYLQRGRGYEAVLLTTVGGTSAALALVAVVAPMVPRWLPGVNEVLRPHSHWIVWCVICFMLMSEWPKGGSQAGAGWRRFLDAWRGLGAGLLTFLLSGFLGFVIMYRPPFPEAAQQNLMPAFVGLFTLPWLLVNVVTAVEIPKQPVAGGRHAGAKPGEGPAGADGGLAGRWRRGWRGGGWGDVARGLFGGMLGGGFAAFFPAVTGGVGAMLAGHTTQPGGDRAFLVSQGASKMVYYVGALLFFFAPGLHMSRGAGAALLRGVCVPDGMRDYHRALAAVALSAAVACVLVPLLARGTIRLMQRTGYRAISAVSIGLALLLVYGTGRWHGLHVLAAGAGIGLLPVLLGSRRLNGLGVILLPLACRMSGVGDAVAEWLGLL